MAILWSMKNKRFYLELEVDSIFVDGHVGFIWYWEKTSFRDEVGLKLIIIFSLFCTKLGYNKGINISGHFVIKYEKEEIGNILSWIRGWYFLFSVDGHLSIIVKNQHS